MPTADEVKLGTEAVLALACPTPRYVRSDNPLAKVGVKHVVYVVKENRTCDQVLGDDPRGNGDPSRTIFGKSVTPNLHALAERFVLLDDFYDCGKVSGFHMAITTGESTSLSVPVTRSSPAIRRWRASQKQPMRG